MKLFAKMKKRIRESDIKLKNIQPAYTNELWHRKMYLVHEVETDK